MAADLNEVMIETVDLGRRSARMSRLFGALLADVRFVDCGSLDVLVYCPDDVAGSAPGDRQLAGTVEGP